MPSPFDHPQMADHLLQHLCCWLNSAEAMVTLALTSRRFARILRSPLAKRVLRLRLSRSDQAPALLGRVLHSHELAKLEELDLCIPDRAKLLELHVQNAHVEALLTRAPLLSRLALHCVRIHHTSIARLGALSHLHTLSIDFTPSSSAGLSASSATCGHRGTHGRSGKSCNWE